MLKRRWQKWISGRFQVQDHKVLKQNDIFVFIWQQGFLYLVLILITFIAGVNYANNLILGFCFLISAVLCVSFYLTFKQLHELQIELKAMDVGQVGQPVIMTLYFKQPRLQPRYLWIQAGEQLEKIKISELSEHIELHFHAADRGLFQYPDIRLYSLYPLGLVRAWTYLFIQAETWVAPKPLSHSTENKKHRQSFQPDMDEFRELRAFQDGDSLQAVSWKQAARGQGLYIKVFEQYEDQRKIEIHYSQMPAFSHEEKLSMMMGIVEQCEQEQHAYAMYLPKAELASGVGLNQLNQAKLLLAQA
ncbi:DUF58 domain-containing protein [Acinetobacter chinensis]|jgi:hypothetical protein|uniref:DUF58 domain-containing protein n=1 Tax=Acinetobacter chinensis TaxID=2004650 RepID=A0ABU3WCC1_9GAMM|nr:DUF58 domain-containing protein [Acinetobacter chinensis]MDV2468061.1 DUF58 domain-containing protein [Acinetobacter chinensis]WOE42798.1 DUF58 domain-containing protein [Acinetobacter chinensis]